MAQHRSITLPPAGVVRGIYLAAVARDNAVVWQTASAEIVESRDVWPDGTAGALRDARRPRGARLDAAHPGALTHSLPPPRRTAASPRPTGALESACLSPPPS